MGWRQYRDLPYRPSFQKKETVGNDILLKPFYTTNTNNFVEDSRKKIWFSIIGKGVICYDPANKKLTQFTGRLY
ncbi:MAG: hypothetical protein ABI472_25050 [Ginsengibacter sp.]